MNTKNIMIVGVGGQGTLLASRIIGNAALLDGYDVKVSEVHGMSQRGGSVVTYVRYGDEVHSPVICHGEADVIIAFEELEAARALPYLKPDGVLITGTQKINPMPVISGAATYPENIIDKLTAAGVRVIALDAQTPARAAGNVRAANVVLLGAAYEHLGFSRETMLRAIEESVPAKHLAVNLTAFSALKG